MSDLLKLADRCTLATEPSRDLDREILFLVMPKERTHIFGGVKHVSTMTGHDGKFWFNPFSDRTDCPHYTGSIDDAMTLKSEDIDIDLSYSIILIDGKAWFAELTGGDPHQTGFWPKQGRGVNGALAICAAALRARAHVGSPAPLNTDD